LEFERAYVNKPIDFRKQFYSLMRVRSIYLALMVLSTFGESQKKNWTQKCYTNSQTWRRSRSGLELYGLRRCGRTCNC
jgi:hypothetical protein